MAEVQSSKSWAYRSKKDILFANIQSIENGSSQVINVFEHFRV